MPTSLPDAYAPPEGRSRPPAGDAPTVRGFTALHRDTWRILLIAPGLLLALPAVLYLPVDLLVAWVVSQSGQVGLQQFQLTSNLSSVFGLVLGTWLSAVALSVLRTLRRGEPLELGPVLAHATARWPTLIGTTLLTGLLILLGALALIVPGIYLAVRLALAVPAVVLDDLGVRAAMERSWQAMPGNMLRYAGVLTLAYVLYAPIAMIPSWFTPEVPSPALWALTSVPLNLLTTGVSVGTALFYLDATGGAAGTPLAPQAPTGSWLEDGGLGLLLAVGGAALGVAAFAVVVSLTVAQELAATGF